MVGAKADRLAGRGASGPSGLTYSDYLRTSDDERYELLNGELLMVPAPNIAHQKAQAELGIRLGAWVKERGLGSVYFAPTDVVLSDSDVVQPDLLFISNERGHVVTRDNVQGAPDLVVEVLSPSTSAVDWTTKRDLYARYGVREYWIVDPDDRTVAVLSLHEGTLEFVRTCGDGEDLTSAVVDGFHLETGLIFGS